MSLSDFYVRLLNNQTFILFTYGEMGRNIDYKKEFDLACEKLAKQEKKIEKLNIKVASLEWEIKWLNSVIDKLKEENQTLELWLDNKEKVNKNLKRELEDTKQVSERDYNIVQNDNNILRNENKKLKEDVDYFRQCYLDLKKLCEKEWFILSDEEVTKMFNLDKIK